MSHRSARRLVLLATTAALLLTWPAAALAHTQLDASVPADGASVDAAVGTVELTFSRSIELLDRSVRVVGDPGRVVDVTRSDDGTVVTATLEPPLPDGSYEVAWRVLAQDSHPREGTVTFTVTGSPAPPPSPGATVPTGEPATPSDAPSAATDPDTGTRDTADVAVTDPEAPDPVELTSTFESLNALARIVLYAGLMVAAGLALFIAWPHRGHTEGAPLLAGWVAGAAVVALLAGVAEVATHVATVSGSGFAGFVDVSTWRSVLRTGLGTALWFRTGGLVLLALGGNARRRSGVASGPDVRKLLGVALVFASFQFVGHTASASPALLVRTADALHALAGAVWIGGIVGLALLSHHGVHQGRAQAAARFSTAATYAVIVVGVAGSALGWANLPELSSLWTTGYGQTLLTKLVFVAGLGALGAYNHLVVVPAVGDDDDHALDMLRRTVVAESVIVMVVIALTALLVSQSPT